MTWRSHHRAERHHGRRRLGSPRRNAGELNSVEEQKEKGLGFFPSQANTCSCAGARACGYVLGCVHARVEATAMATTETTAATRRSGKTNDRTRKKGRLAGLRARRRRQRHLQETISQPGSMAGITQRVRGGVPRHGGEHTRLDARPRLEGRAPQEGRTVRRSPTIYVTRR
jgi:hypothetical protein